MEGALAGRVRRCAGFDLFLAEPVSPVPNQILSVFNSIRQPPAKLSEITVGARQEFERQENGKKNVEKRREKTSRKSPATTAGLFYCRSIRSRTN
jgi:hypothetical protein